MTSPLSIPENVQTPFRSPEVVFTDSYLDNPIQFNPDVRLVPASIIELATSGSGFERDFSLYLRVNLQSQAKTLYSVNMYNNVYNRIEFEKTIDTSLPNF